MAVTVEEYEPGIIWKTFSNSWTAEELIASRQDELRIAAHYSGTVDVIADMSGVQRLPFDVGKAVYQFLRMDWSGFGVWAVITRNGLVRRVVLRIAQHTALRNRVYFVNSPEEALDLIQRKRIERANRHPNEPDYPAQL